MGYKVDVDIHTQAIDDIIVAIATDIDAKQAELLYLDKQIDEKKRLLQITRDECNLETDHLLGEKSQLEKSIKPLREEEARLNEDISQLVSKKSDLMLDNSRLLEENKKFKLYEEKAWKVLDAKEQELLTREQAIEQKEALKPRNKSLLPPIE